MTTDRQHSQLLSREIFIDTRYFLGKSLDFKNKEFQALEAIVKKGLARVFITDITEMELLKKIDEEVAVSYAKINSSDIRYLKSIPLFVRFLTTYPIEEAKRYFLDSYFSFKKRCKVIIVPSDKVKIRTVFHDYCRLEPPFRSDASKSRKSEFPDAFALATIMNWCQETQKKTYILSGDSDWETYAEKTFIHIFAESDELWLNTINTLSEFLDLIIRTEKNLEDLTTFSDSLVDSNRDLIEKEAKLILRKCTYHDDSIELDSEITKHYILSATLDQKEIITVSRDNAVYNLEFKIDLVLQYLTESYENAVYDSDSKIYRNIKTYTSFQRFTTYEPLTIEVIYKDGIASNFKIVSFEAPDPIYVIYEDGSEFNPDKWALNLPVLVCGVSNGEITENGNGFERFDNMTRAKEGYPMLDINKSSSMFTAATGNRISEELRFETWKASEFYSMD